jgi:protein disulfide-isomerase-like protein
MAKYIQSTLRKALGCPRKSLLLCCLLLLCGAFAEDIADELFNIEEIADVFVNMDEVDIFDDAPQPAIIEKPSLASVVTDEQNDAAIESPTYRSAEIYMQKANRVEAQGAHQLTSRTLAQFLNNDHILLVEFYTPWCGHCTSFSATYEEVAKHFHGSEKLKVKVAKVNAQNERALSSRFGVHSYPSFFILDGWKAYSFEKPRSKKNLVDFASGGYKKQDPVPFYASPFGPLGLLQGLMIAAGLSVEDLFQWMQKQGLSPIMSGTIMFGTLFFGCFFMILFLAIMITPKLKAD